MAPSVSGSKRDAEDPDNKGEGVEDGGQADLHRKRLKSHHGGDEELQPPLESRFLGGPWFTLNSLFTTIDIWRTATRTYELDVGSVYFRGWNKLTLPVRTSNPREP